MSAIIEPADFGKLLKGVEINVYQAKGYGGKPGEWHAHVSTNSGWGTRRNYFEGCVLPPTDRSIRGAEGKDEPYPQPKPRKVRAIRNGGGGYYWMDCGYYDSQDVAREHACLVVGHIFGKRLAEKIGPQEVPAQHFSAEKQVRFA